MQPNDTIKKAMKDNNHMTAIVICGESNGGDDALFHSAELLSEVARDIGLKGYNVCTDKYGIFVGSLTDNKYYNVVDLICALHGKNKALEERLHKVEQYCLSKVEVVDSKYDVPGNTLPKVKYPDNKCTVCKEDKNMYGGCRCNGYTIGEKDEN